MILFITDQSKLRDKLASLVIKDIVTDSKLLKKSILNEYLAFSIVSVVLLRFSSR